MSKTTISPSIHSLAVTFAPAILLGHGSSFSIRVSAVRSPQCEGDQIARLPARPLHEHDAVTGLRCEEDRELAGGSVIEITNSTVCAGSRSSASPHCRVLSAVRRGRKDASEVLTSPILQRVKYG